jgi:hypothetical protein
MGEPGGGGGHLLGTLRDRWRALETDHFCLWEQVATILETEGYVKGGSGNGPRHRGPFGEPGRGLLTRDFERQVEGSVRGTWREWSCSRNPEG